MENWHLFTAAFVLSLVDLSVLGAFLWYQFSTLYFAWHLCPMIVNRICELIAFMFTGGMLPSLFAIVQVPLSLFSTTIYANRQQRLQNKLLFAVYCTLLVYEFLVAVLMVKMGRYLKYPASLGSQQSRSLPGQQAPQPYIAFHMFALFTQPLGSSCPYVGNPERHQDSQVDGFVTVQQPDGKKVMLGKVLQSKLESTAKVTEVEGTGVGNGGKDGDVRVTITSLAMPSEAERGYPCDRSLTLPAQTTEGSSCMHLTSLDSGHLDHETLSCQWTASPPEEVHCDGVKVDCACADPLSCQATALPLEEVHCDGVKVDCAHVARSSCQSTVSPPEEVYCNGVKVDCACASLLSASHVDISVGHQSVSEPSCRSDYALSSQLSALASETSLRIESEEAHLLALAPSVDHRETSLGEMV